MPAPRQTPGSIHYSSPGAQYTQAVPPLPQAPPSPMQMGMGIGDLTPQAIKDHAAAAAWPIYKAALFVAVVALALAVCLWLAFGVNPRVLAGLVVMVTLATWGWALYTEYHEAQELNARVKARHDNVNARLRPSLVVMPGGTGVAPQPAAVRYGGVPEAEAVRIILRFALVRAACEARGEAQPGTSLVVPHTPVGFPSYDNRMHAFAMRTLRDLGFVLGGTDSETGKRTNWRCTLAGQGHTPGQVVGMLEPYLLPGAKLDELIATGRVRQAMTESGAWK